MMYFISERRFLLWATATALVVYVNVLAPVLCEDVKPPEALMCVNDDCTGVISIATTVTKYLNQARFLLPFKANTKVRVVAKPKDPNEEYWGVELNGVYGFVPRQFLKENSVLLRPKRDVPLEVFMKTIKTLNREHFSRLKKEQKNNEEPIEEEKRNEAEDDDDDDDDDEVAEEEKDEEVPPDKTEELQTTTAESIISSTLSNSNINVEDIKASQPVTVIAGTTIYDSFDNVLEVEKNIPEEPEEIKPAMYSLQSNEIGEKTTQSDEMKNDDSDEKTSDTTDSINNSDNVLPDPIADVESIESNVTDSSIETPSELQEDVDEKPSVQIDTPLVIEMNGSLDLSSEKIEKDPESSEIVQEVKEEEEQQQNIHLNTDAPADIIEQLDVVNNNTDFTDVVENITEENLKDPLTASINNNFVSSEVEQSFEMEKIPEESESLTESFASISDHTHDEPVQTESSPTLDFIYNEAATEVTTTAVVNEYIESPSSEGPTLDFIHKEPEEVTTQSTVEVNEYINYPSSESPTLDFIYKEVAEVTTQSTVENPSSESPTIDFIYTQPVEVSTESTVEENEYINYPSSDYLNNMDDKLTVDIENEKSFFSSPLILLNDLYSTFSSMFKSNGLTTTTEKANTNIFESNQFDDNTDTSKNYLPIYSESSQSCSADDRYLPNFSDVSVDFISWLVVSAITVLLFTLGYYYLENRKQDGKLLAMVNSLQKELLCSSKECIILKEELSVTKEKLIGIEDSSFGTDEMVTCLKKELSDYQQTITDLQEKLSSTEEELAHSTEAALELQSILDEQLSAKDTSSSSLTFTITNLQTQLDDQQTTMNATKAQLAVMVEENELLRLKVLDENNKCAIVEKQLANTQESLKKISEENESKNLQIQQLTTNLEKSLHQAEVQKKLEVKELQSQLKLLTDELGTVKASLKAGNHEVQSLQEAIKMLKLDDKNIDAILDVSHTKAELVKIVAEKNILNDKYEAEIVNIEELNKKVEAQNNKLLEMKEKLNDADHKTLEATTRLEVLTNYFNQKEADLLKELSAKESLWMSKQGEAVSTVEKMQALQQEIQQQKEITESVRREVIEQEAASRAKVATLEQRVHEHWLARRAAERSAEASAREAQTLRQRLAAPSPDKRVVSPLTTGESLPDPAFMPPLGVLPPPPLAFLPPPLGGPMMLPPPLPPHRPPPLGRLSSPPPLLPMRQDRSYSPDSRYSPDRAYSPHQRGRSPFSNSESRRRNYNRRYDDRYYDSEEDRRSRRYETETDFSPINTLPPSPIPNSRNHKGVSSGSGQSYDSLEKLK